MNNDKKYPHLPQENDRLRKICSESLAKEYPESVPNTVHIRLDRELAVIESFDMCGVFLILRELILKSGLRRYELGYSGMAGASLAAWLCGLTAINPMETRISFYPQTLFGMNYDKEPDIELRVPKGMAKRLYAMLPELDGISDAVCPLQEDGTPVSMFRLIIPENVSSDRSELYIHATPFYRVKILDDENLRLLSRMVELTGVFPDYISLEDPAVLEMYQHTDFPSMIEISPWHLTAIGLPGIRTSFAIGMYGSVDVQINGFEDLVRLESLSHGTNVWAENQEKLVHEDSFPFSKIITCREDVFEFCRDALHLNEEMSFRIMEYVRKGKGFPRKWFEKETGSGCSCNAEIPEWFIDVCDKVRYLFPRPHSYSRMLISWRCAWYRLYYPAAFYQAYFEIRADEEIKQAVFAGRNDYDVLIEKDPKRRYPDLQQEENVLELSDTDAESFAIDLAVADEMYFRGIDLTSPFLKENQCTAKFLIQEMKKTPVPENDAAFLKEWSQGNLEIFDCDEFGGQYDMQEALLELINEAWKKGHRFTLHFKDNVRDCKKLLDGLNKMIKSGQVIIKKKQKIFLYGLSPDEIVLVEDYYGNSAELLDVTPQYQDIIVLCADVVIINKDNVPQEALHTVMEFDQEVQDPDVQYYYCSGDEIRKLFQKR